MMKEETEKLRQQYKPDKIRLLFIGESPPDSGDFFYEEDKKSNMTNYTQQAFEKAYKISFSNHVEFLRYFQEGGCYLDDLSHEPVDKKPQSEREEILKQSKTALSARLKEYKPEVIIIALKKIEKYVKQAIKEAFLSCPTYTLPFAGRGHQKKYMDALTEIIKRHMIKKT